MGQPTSEQIETIGTVYAIFIPSIAEWQNKPWSSPDMNYCPHVRPGTLKVVLFISFILKRQGSSQKSLFHQFNRTELEQPL